MLSPAPHTGHVSADAAEDVVDDHDAAVDEEEDDDEDEVLVEEDQMQAMVCIASIFVSNFAKTRLCSAKSVDCVPPQEGVGEEEADEDEDKPLSSHPDADTIIIFTTGEGWCGSWSIFYYSFFNAPDSICPWFLCVTTSEFPANEIVKFLVGFTNKGSQDFTVQSLEASFRYPQDFQFYIQNVSLICNTILTSK